MTINKVEIMPAPIGVSLRVAAQMFSVSQRTVERWVEERGCPQTKIGGRCIYDPDALRAWFATFSRTSSEVSSEVA